MAAYPSHNLTCWHNLCGAQHGACPVNARLTTGWNSRIGCSPSSSLSPTRSAAGFGKARQRHRPPSRASVSTFARRRGGGPDWDDNHQRGSGRSGFQFSNKRGMYRIQYNEYETEVRQEEAWKLLVPLVGGLVLAAAVIGPLIIGLAFTAVAVGAAFSAGALFTSLFLPFFLLVGAGALFFGGVTFSAFATLGTALLLPKLIMLAVVGGGLGLGALAVSLFLKPAADRAKRAYAADSERRKGKGTTIDMEPEPEAQADPEVDRQLREFDELLQAREEQQLRTERWKAGGSGGGGRGGRR